MELRLLRILRRLYLLSVLLVCVPFLGKTGYVPMERLDAKERTAIFYHIEAENELRNEGYHFYRDINALDSLTYRLIDSYVPDSVADDYALDKQTLISCIQTIAISEGSITTKKGNRAFRSSLFLFGNNPFGIKGKGSYVKTVEYFDGVRYVLFQNFQSYPNFRIATLHLLRILYLGRYDGVREATNIEEFFNALKEGGYLTAPSYHKRFLIPYAIRLDGIETEIS